MCQGYCMVVFENECKKTNTRSQTQKYLSLGKFTLAPLCEPHKIEIVQEKRQETFVVIVVGRHECCPVFLGGQQIAQINKSAVVKDNLDEYLIYAVNEMALLPSVMFAIYIDGIYYANRGVYVDDATTINCEYSLNEEVLSHYDPNFVKGL